jgi:hypothetical protein
LPAATVGRGPLGRYHCDATSAKPGREGFNPLKNKQELKNLQFFFAGGRFFACFIVRRTVKQTYDASLTYLPFLGVSSLINWPRRLNAGAAIFFIPLGMNNFPTPRARRRRI